MNENLQKYYVNKMGKSRNYNDFYVFKNSDLSPVQHIHDCYEFEIVLSGEFKEIINGKVIDAKSGNIFLISPSDIHELSFEKSPTIYNVLFRENVISEKNMRKLYRFLQNDVVCAYFEPKEFKDICSLVDRAIDEYNNVCDDLSESIIANIIECIFLIFMRQHFGVLNKTIDSRIEKAQLYIDKNFQEHITMVDIAQMVGLDEDYFSSLFYKCTKMRFKDYLAKHRLSYACKRLIETNDTIADICYDSGFNSLPTFHREFKSFFNCTPLEYRKKYTKDFK